MESCLKRGSEKEKESREFNLGKEVAKKMNRVKKMLSKVRKEERDQEKVL